jgi:hypothetical protein
LATHRERFRENFRIIADMGKQPKQLAERRARLFQIYARNLDEIAQHPGVEVEEHRLGEFMCPLCYRHFPKTALTQGHQLTLEHVPPRSLGGTLATCTLTCQACNNDGGGAQLDSYLVRRLDVADVFADVPRASIDIRYSIKNKHDEVRNLKGSLTKVGSDTLHITQQSERMNPSDIDRVMEMFRAGNTHISAENVYSETQEAAVAFLRIGYLEAFRRFGYSFLMGDSSQYLSAQIRNPSLELLPPDSWFFRADALPDHQRAMYVVVAPEQLRCLLVVISLRSRLGRTEPWAVILPIGPELADLQIYHHAKRVINTDQLVEQRLVRLEDKVYVYSEPWAYLSLARMRP